MITEDKIDIAHNNVKNAMQDLRDALEALEKVSENLTYRSFAYDVVSECVKMIYVIKSKLETVAKITEKI